MGTLALDFGVFNPEKCMIGDIMGNQSYGEPKRWAKKSLGILEERSALNIL